jgi:alkanesulfonate monooxygenase SsuD/methylene tetrahydromethanopterin reductase-like flavin-dependent oxidoreductase (luciferase family)
VGVRIPPPALRFGVFLTPAADGYPQLLEQVAAAERGGLELVGIQDHPYQPRYLDAFALIGDLLARTERIRLFPGVANLPLRQPALLANLASSLDVMSGGRFELGIGAGAFWEGIEAMGGPRRSPGESVEALGEAIEILRAAWSGDGSVTFDGEHYSVRGFKPGPPPAHPIGIWVGAYKPRMLALTGRLADGWFPSLGYAPPERIPAMRDRLDAAIADAGRDPGDVRRIYNVSGSIFESDWVETLSGFILDLGFDDIVFGPSGEETRRQIEVFAGEVVPAVRERVAGAA